MHFIDPALYNLVSGWDHKKPFLLTIDAHYWPCTKIFDHPTVTGATLFAFHLVVLL